MVRLNGKRSRVYESSVDTLRRMVSYDPETGTMMTLGKYNTVSRTGPNGYNLLKVATSLDELDYGTRKTNYYRVDHLAWYLMTGQWPNGWIEHLNGIVADDSIENLIHLDEERMRWWYGTQAGMNERSLVRVEDTEDGSEAVIDVYLQGNDGVQVEEVIPTEGGGEPKTVLKPRVAKGWVQRALDAPVQDMERLGTIEPAPDLAKGEFGRDWT